MEELVMKRNVRIDYLYLDLTSCERCIGTDEVLEEVIRAIAPVLDMAGYRVEYHKKEMSTPELAEQYHFLSSPTILVNGRDIFGSVRESACGCCGEIAGVPVDCREFEYEGVSRTVPTKRMIADALLKSLYLLPACSDEPYVLPENLRRFYEGKDRKSAASFCKKITAVKEKKNFSRRDS